MQNEEEEGKEGRKIEESRLTMKEPRKKKRKLMNTVARNFLSYIPPPYCSQLPYFDGDFWPGMIEETLRDMRVSRGNENASSQFPSSANRE